MATPEGLAYRAQEWKDAFARALSEVGGELELMTHTKEARLEAMAMFGALYGGANKLALRAVCSGAPLNLEKDVLLVAIGNASTKACGVRSSDSKICSFPDGENEYRDLDALVGTGVLNTCDDNSPNAIKLATLIALWAERIGATDVIFHDSIGYKAQEETQLLEVASAEGKYGVVHHIAREIKDSNTRVARVWLWPKSSHFRQLRCPWESEVAGTFFHVNGKNISGHQDGAPLLYSGEPYEKLFSSNEIIELATKESTQFFLRDSKDEVNRVAQVMATALQEAASANAADVDAGRTSFAVVHTGEVRDHISRSDVAAVMASHATGRAGTSNVSIDYSPMTSPAMMPALRQSPTVKLPPLASPTPSKPLDETPMEQRKEIKRAQKEIKQWRERFKQNNGRVATDGDYPSDVKVSMMRVKEYWREQRSREIGASSSNSRPQQTISETKVEISGAHLYFNGAYTMSRDPSQNGSVFYTKKPEHKGAPQTFLYKSSRSGKWNLVDHEEGMLSNKCSYTSSHAAVSPTDSNLQFMEVSDGAWAKSSLKVVEPTAAQISSSAANLAVVKVQRRTSEGAPEVKEERDSKKWKLCRLFGFHFELHRHKSRSN